ncbi:hypothetical protein HanPSC8_Chr02g0081451 [Helianthus annuus]|nr:hypothetical protein HanPSC8_Chr02g0081451 [Helianthus annuus]
MLDGSPPLRLASIDKSSATSLWRSVSLSGIFLVKLLLDKLMIFTNSRVMLNSRKFPCHLIMERSTYARLRLKECTFWLTAIT